MTNKFETVKRVANVGERILITESAAFTFINGEVFTVREVVNDVVKVYGHDVPIYPFEYEVIIDRIEILKPDTKTQLVELIDQLHREGYAEGFDAGRAFERGEDEK